MTSIPNPVQPDSARSVADAKARLLAWAQQVDDEAAAQAERERKASPMHGMASAVGSIVVSRLLGKVERSSRSTGTRVALRLLRYAVAAKLFTPLIKSILASVKRL